MNIGQAAAQSGLAVKTLRYYEQIGLVVPLRTEGNTYRDYSAVNVAHLGFLRRARAAGFSLDVCRELLSVYRDEARRSSTVRREVLEQVAQVEQQLQELQALKAMLIGIANDCVRDDSADYSDRLPPTQHAFMPFMLVEPPSE